jgi:hypothetical protein
MPGFTNAAFKYSVPRSIPRTAEPTAEAGTGKQTRNSRKGKITVISIGEEKREAMEAGDRRRPLGAIVSILLSPLRNTSVRGALIRISFRTYLNGGNKKEKKRTIASIKSSKFQ